MDDETTAKEIAKKVLAALDEAIEKGPWDKSILLRNTGKKLRELRFNFKSELNLEDDVTSFGTHDHLANRVASRAGQLEVFVSVYNADGGNIKKWERLLQNLTGQIVTRPIYRSEQDIRQLIRSKINKKNEAYFVVYISKEHIVKPFPGKEPKDRFGHQLLLLREEAIKAENITRFMHLSGEYRYKDNRLVRQGDV